MAPDVFFQVYTHGQLIDDAMAKRAADLGNVAFAISIEGGPNATDLRRGPGTYERISASMKRLQDAGVLYGFSGTHTTKNHHSIASEEFYRDMLDKGCVCQRTLRCEFRTTILAPARRPCSASLRF